MVCIVFPGFSSYLYNYLLSTLSCVDIIFYSLAQFRHMVALVESELGEWHSHGDLPALALGLEGSVQLLDEPQEAVLVRETATSVRRSRVLPVQVKPIEVVFVHELCQYITMCLKILFCWFVGHIFGTFHSFFIRNNISTCIEGPLVKIPK